MRILRATGRVVHGPGNRPKPTILSLFFAFGSGLKRVGNFGLGEDCSVGLDLVFFCSVEPNHTETLYISFFFHHSHSHSNLNTNPSRGDMSSSFLLSSCR